MQTFYRKFNALKLQSFIRTVLLSILFATLMFSTTTHADTQKDPALLPYELTYAATYNGMDINAKRQLTSSEGHYTLTTTAENMLSNIEEKSEFLLDNSGTIVDQDYQYKRSILGIKKKEKLTYDRETGTAHYKSKKKERQVNLDDGQLNRLTYQVQLQRDLLNLKNPALKKPNATFEYQVISRGRLKTYRFEVIGDETLETPLGNVKATKVKRIRKNNDRETLFWFAPQWNYTLVQLWQREKGGDDYKIVLQKGTHNGQQLGQL